MDGRPLSNTVGTVLDSIFALRHRVRVPPGRTVRIAFWTVVASSRSDVLDLADKHHDATAFDRAATLAWTQVQVQLGHLGVDRDQASLFQRLAGHVLYADPSMRPSSDTIRRGGGGPAVLWAQGISGDIPIVLARIDNVEDVAIVRQLLRAHEYWRMKHLAVDLVILNERASSYIQDLQIALETLARTSQSRPQIGADIARGAVFVMRADLVSVETRALLLSMARAVLVGRHGTLSEQLNRLQEADTAATLAERAPPRRVPPADGIALDLLQCVPLDDPIKISRLTIRNTSGRPRRLSVTAYVEWVLGPSRGASALSVVTELDPETGAMLARNPWNMTFGSRVAFADLGGRQTAWTGDRGEFLGRNGTLDNPAALAGEALLSQRVGAGLDPCGALQSPVELKPGGIAEIVFFLGEAATAADAQSLIARYRAADLDAVLREVVGYWDDVLGAVQVKTPDRSMDIMLNRWMLYQTLACRMWARSAFYQASGAYGFRDQLQDGMALALSRPALTREHLLRAAARQFVEGDVQHWWLPPSGQGVRTRVSDDRIWLAYAAAHYVETTGDIAVLDEPIQFLEGQALQSGEHDAYFQPTIADESATLFEHRSEERRVGKECRSRWWPEQ